MKLIMTLAFFISFSCFALTTGEKAPDFSLKGINSKTKDVSLSDFKGKFIVLEWLNHGCPFVKKHYGSGNMQKLQKEFTGKDVVWLSIISSAPNKQGHVDHEGAVKEKAEKKSFASDILLDPTGVVGQLYKAKTTPHMFIINKEGNLIYQGAIDSEADADQASIPKAKNYISEALNEAISGKKVTAHTTASYGCQVKY